MASHHAHLARIAAGVSEVLELGTFDGDAARAILDGLGANGRLTSVDLQHVPHIEDPRWRFILGDDLDPVVYAQLAPADLIFIDTSHLYDHTCAELALYRWLVKPGGIIACHDTQVEQPREGGRHGPPFPVRRAVDEFCAENGYRWSDVDGWPGLGIIEGF